MVEDRDDLEIKALYNLMHDTYEKYGGIQEQHWLNLYDPFNKHQLDFINNFLGGHPGPKSQEVVAALLRPEFNRIFN
jgi:hypothetical protein